MKYLGIDILLSPCPFHLSFRMRTKRSTPIYILKSFITPFFFYSSPTNPYPRFFINSSRRVLKRSSNRSKFHPPVSSRLYRRAIKNISDSSRIKITKQMHFLCFRFVFNRHKRNYYVNFSSLKKILFLYL